MALAAIALGANLGDRHATLQQAAVDLGTLGQVVAVSTFFDTEPVGYAEQPRFLNAAALLRTDLQPLELLPALLAIERRHGRDRSHGIEKGPRTLDLDLLLYDDVAMETPNLTLPHPQMHCRLFVLEPLAQIAPGLVHPRLCRSVADLLAALRGSGS